MSNESEMQATRERLSALADGELEAGAVSQACAQWRESGETRATWHAYQLIGDVLRSDDLAADPARDARFMAGLRTRLAAEPVVLAPQPLPSSVPAVSVGAQRAAGGRRWAWLAPTAVAASFVAVAGVLTLSRSPGLLPESSPAVASMAPQLLPSSTVPVATLIGASGAAAAEPLALVASGQMIRDARLDRYLAAHKQFAGSSALGVPSGLLRNATAEATGR